MISLIIDASLGAALIVSPALRAAFSLPRGAIADIFFAVEYEPGQHDPQSEDDSPPEFDPDSEPEYDPDFEPAVPEGDFFGRVNNYLLLVYAGACFLMYVSLSGILVLGKMVVLALSLPGILAFILPLFVLAKRFSLGFANAYRIEAPDMRTLLCVLLISGSSILPVEVVSSIFERTWPPDADYINFILSIKPKGILSFVATAAGLVVITPLAEELLFRGFIQRIFQRNMSGAMAVILAGLIFALAHFELIVVPATIILGIIFGYLFYRTGNLLYPVIAHGMYNLVSLLRLHLTSIEDLEAGGYASLSTTWAIASFLLLILGILVLERIRAPSDQAMEE